MGWKIVVMRGRTRLFIEVAEQSPASERFEPQHHVDLERSQRLMMWVDSLGDQAPGVADMLSDCLNDVLYTGVHLGMGMLAERMRADSSKRPSEVLEELRKEIPLMRARPTSVRPGPPEEDRGPDTRRRAR
ncbi:MAG TPA: hypothetical protein VI588_02305 [Candidatus Gracilibacteria bacterium]|nr:hypothetical protein [Candidatus Gracilibacteria bacterium]